MRDKTFKNGSAVSWQVQDIATVQKQLTQEMPGKRSKQIQSAIDQWLVPSEMALTTMKIMALMVALFLCATAMGQGLQLTVGESYTYTFTSLDYLGPSTPGVLGGLDFGARFAGDLVDPGDSIRMEMFEGTLLDGPFAASTFTGASVPLDLLNLHASQLPSHWSDLQGAVRLTVLTGSANLARIGVSAEIGPSSYGNFVPVPEPSTFVVCSLTGLLAVLWRKR